MRTVTNLLNAALKIDLPYQVELSLIESSEEYVRLQNEQMARGERSDGKPIFNVKTGSYTYSPAYAKKKGKTKPIDLHDKGDFYKETFIHVDGPDKVIVDSADSKSGMLQETYGDKIFGLNDESKIEFIPIAQQNLINGITKELNHV